MFLAGHPGHLAAQETVAGHHGTAVQQGKSHIRHATYAASCTDWLVCLPTQEIGRLLDDASVKLPTEPSDFDWESLVQDWTPLLDD